MRSGAGRGGGGRGRDAAFYGSPNPQSALAKLRKRELEARRKLAEPPRRQCHESTKCIACDFIDSPAPSSKTTSSNNDGLRIRATSSQSSIAFSLFPRPLPPPVSSPAAQLKSTHPHTRVLALWKFHPKPSDLGGGKECAVARRKVRDVCTSSLLLNLCNKERATEMETSAFQNVFSKMHFRYLLYVLAKKRTLFFLPWSTNSRKTINVPLHSDSFAFRRREIEGPAKNSAGNVSDRTYFCSGINKNRGTYSVTSRY